MGRRILEEQFMYRAFHDSSRYFMQLGGQDLRQNPDFAAIINVQGELLLLNTGRLLYAGNAW